MKKIFKKGENQAERGRVAAIDKSCANPDPESVEWQNSNRVGGTPGFDFVDIRRRVASGGTGGRSKMLVQAVRVAHGASSKLHCALAVDLEVGRGGPETVGSMTKRGSRTEDGVRDFRAGASSGSLQQNFEQWDRMRHQQIRHPRPSVAGESPRSTSSLCRSMNTGSRLLLAAGS
ncbi:hypothetical protein B0H11DRAFT_1899455 [Mycena galericulata]|nr:hypothetical protein B0H11DRAFT_1899455 [Mycena galericulata]